jgi:hypothetical protein
MIPQGEIPGAAWLGASIRYPLTSPTAGKEIAARHAASCTDPDPLGPCPISAGCDMHDGHSGPCGGILP